MASYIHSAHRVSSLYVGDLHPAVSELMLMEKFSPFGPISSTRVCRDRHTRQSLGYGYVNFVNTADAEHAMEILMFDLLMGRPMRIMWAQRSPELRNSGVGNIYIQGLAENIDSLALYDTFSHFGTILSSKVVCDEHGSKGYGYVHYTTYEAAETAIQKLDGMLLNDQQVSICHYKTFQDRKADMNAQRNFKSRFPGVNLYVNNLPYSWTDEQLYGVFSSFGLITSSKVMIKNGRSKGFGFVCFESPEAAEKAIVVMNGRVIGNRSLNVALSRLKDQDVQETGDTSKAPLPVGNPSEPPLPSGVFSDVPDVPQAHSCDDQQTDNQLIQIVPSCRQEAEGLLPKWESLLPLISPLLLETVSPVLPRMLVSPALLDYKVTEELPELNPVQPTDVPETSATCSAVCPLLGQENSQLGKGLVGMGNMSSSKMMVIMDGAASRILICCYTEDTTMTSTLINHQDVLPQSDLLFLLAQNMAEFMSGQSTASLLERLASEDQSSPFRAIQGVQAEYDQEVPDTTQPFAPRTVRPVFTRMTQKLASPHTAAQTLHILPEDLTAVGNAASGPRDCWLGSSKQSAKPLWCSWLKKSLESCWRWRSFGCPTSRDILSLCALRRFQL